MNEHSSRSHSVFLISVKQQNIEKQKTLSGKLYLVDLAGSEKVSKTGAEGTVLDEAKQINKSLSALGNVINALVEGSPHVPYRDSKLTRILQESLGGNARTTMVICCSPATVNEAETRSTLLFGTRAKTIKNTVMVNEELTADEWRRRFERERDKNGRLRGFLLKLEAELLRWRQGERVSETEQCELLKDDILSMSVDASLQLAAAAAAPPPPAAPAAPAAMTLSSVGLPKSSQPWELERAMLYKQLDDRDGEINSLSQYVEKLKVQMLEQEELVSAMRRDADASQNELIRLQAENESRNEEVKEVLNALEELALNYDAKQLELQSKTSEFDALQAELGEKALRAAEIEAEMSTLRDNLAAQRKRFTDVLLALLKDFAELVSQLQAAACPQNGLPQPTTVTGLDNGELKTLLATLTSEQRIDDEHLALVRLQLNKAKTELRLLVSRCAQLEQSGNELQTKLAASELDVGNARLAVQQHEARVAALQDSLSTLETRKRALEDQLDEAQEETARLRAQDQLRAAAAATTQSQADEVRVLAEQLEQHRDSHHKQLTELRNELSTKEHELDRLREERQNVQLAFERTQSELERARAEQLVNAAKLVEAQAALAQHEQARADLKGLEETVARELATLHQLRKLFIADLQTRIKRSLQQKAPTTEGATTPAGNGSDSDSDAQPTTLAGQRQRIAFLESNLESLTKVHKQLVHDNADLRLEIPKLEKRLRATYERVKALEHALKEAKEAAIRDRKRYQLEVDRIKEAVRQKNLAASRRLHTAQIAKPIRAGQPHAVVTAGMPPVLRPVLSGGAAALVHD